MVTNVIAITHGRCKGFPCVTIAKFCEKRNYCMVHAEKHDEKIRYNYNINSKEWAKYKAQKFVHIYDGAFDELMQLQRQSAN